MIAIRHRTGRCIEFKDTEGKWKSTGTHDREEAILVASAFLKTGNTDIFGKFAEEVITNTGPGSYIDMMRQLSRLDDSTFTEFKTSAKIYVIPFFKNMKLCEITAPKIQMWYMNMKLKNGKKASVHTSNNALSALSRILGYAEMLGKIESNPCRLVKRKRKESTGYPIFTEEEIKKLLPESIPDLIKIYGTVDIALFFLIIRDTGFRPCEVAGLTTSCYHPEFGSVFTRQSCDRATRKIKKSIKTTGRGYDDRTGFLKPFTEKVMKLVIDMVPPGSCLFIKRNGCNRGQKYFNDKLNDVMIALGIEKNGRCLYSFRSTFFTNLLAHHTDQASMMMMGHTNWHSCYDQRTPEQIIERTRRILDSSNI